MTIANLETPINLDPTMPAPMTMWPSTGLRAGSKSGPTTPAISSTPRRPTRSARGSRAEGADPPFGPELYRDQPTGWCRWICPKSWASRPVRRPAPRCWPTSCASAPVSRSTPRQRHQPAVLRAVRTGIAAVNGRLVRWEKGDFLTLPAGSQAVFYADAEAAMYWVHDEPLMRYLGADATRPRFRPTKFRRADAVAKLEDIASRPGANDKSRVSVLLANARQEQTLTITHVLWAMFGVLPAGQEQRPHRHQSVALDLILDAPPGLLHPAGHPLMSAGTSSTRSGWTGKPAARSSPRLACGTPTTTRPIPRRT